MNFKSIKYSPKEEQEFFGVLKQRVNEYFKNGKSNRANLKMVIKTILMVASYFIPFIAMFIWGNTMATWLFFVLWIVMGFAMAGIGLSIMHDANHGAYSNSPAINGMLGALLNVVGGSAHNWKIQHNVLHHTYTNVTGYDEDIQPVDLLRFSPHEELKPIHKYQHLYAWFFYGLMTLEWTTTKDFRGLKRYNEMGFVKGSYALEVLRLLFWKVLYFSYVLVLPILMWDYAEVWQILLGFFLMHFTSGLMLGFIFQPAHVMETSEFPMPNEKDTIENSWAVHQMYTTANFAPKNFWLNWYAGGLNYQIEHHLFPNICHIHYKGISKIVKKTAEEFNIPYNVQPSFAAAIWNHMKMLKKLGRA